MVRVIGEVRTDREIYLVSSSGLVSGGGSSDVTATFGFPSEVRGVDSARCQVTSVVEE